MNQKLTVSHVICSINWQITRISLTSAGLCYIYAVPLDVPKEQRHFTKLQCKQSYLNKLSRQFYGVTFKELLNDYTNK